MYNLFTVGDLVSYRSINLNEAMAEIPYSTTFAKSKTTIFLSHHHSDVTEVTKAIGYLESTYGVKVYIDSNDTALPTITSKETATILKKRINQCDRFIFLATDGAIDSKWCNWELGFGDAKKLDSRHIALLPIKRAGINNDVYSGKEYFSVYPYIVRVGDYDVYSKGSFLPKGDYVAFYNSIGSLEYESLSHWLQ